MARMSDERGNRLTWIGAGLLRVRWFVRAPIWLYRARLGVIFGHRLLMLEHVGRNTGQRRFVVLEVVDHPAPDRYVVVSGFGTRAQWFRNVEANSQVCVYLASYAPVPAAIWASHLRPIVPGLDPAPSPPGRCPTSRDDQHLPRPRMARTQHQARTTSYPGL